MLASTLRSRDAITVGMTTFSDSPDDRLAAAALLERALSLDRRLTRRAEVGRGMQLTADDVDLLVVSGALGAVRRWAEAQLEEDRAGALRLRRSEPPAPKVLPPPPAPRRGMDRLAGEELALVARAAERMEAEAVEAILAAARERERAKRPKWKVKTG